MTRIHSNIPIDIHKVFKTKRTFRKGRDNNHKDFQRKLRVVCRNMSDN